MRQKLRRILAILDGTPTASRGQSLVELSLTMPLLLVLLLGLTEIGWYANNYMTLLDVVREAGRYGSTKDPMAWVDGEEHNRQRMDCEELATNYDKKPFENQTSWPGPGDLATWGFQDGGERPVGYYDGVACSVISNMAPLEFNDLTDEITVSVFSFAVLYPGTTNAVVRVVGRYPSTANECTNDDEFDPFDWNPPDNDPTDDYENLNGGYDIGAEDVRGYVFRGNHRMDFGGPRACLGSAFSTKEVQDKLDFTGDPDRQRKVQQVANYGLVLVEVFWRHRQLLGLSWFNLGSLTDGQMIHVWAFFPVSAAEPDLEF